MQCDVMTSHIDILPPHSTEYNSCVSHLLTPTVTYTHVICTHHAGWRGKQRHVSTSAHTHTTQHQHTLPVAMYWWHMMHVNVIDPGASSMEANYATNTNIGWMNVYNPNLKYNRSCVHLNLNVSNVFYIYINTWIGLWIYGSIYISFWCVLYL